jgi:hypothetical protein
LIEESGSHQTASSATQSAIFAFFTESSKIARTSAHFLRPEGTGEARFGLTLLISATFSLSRTYPVLFAPRSAKTFARSSLSGGCSGRHHRDPESSSILLAVTFAKSNYAIAHSMKPRDAGALARWTVAR